MANLVSFQHLANLQRRSAYVYLMVLRCCFLQHTTEFQIVDCVTGVALLRCSLSKLGHVINDSFRVGCCSHQLERNRRRITNTDMPPILHHHSDGRIDLHGLAVSLYIDLTRFNKIAIQGTPQMAVDKEAICLSRVYSYYPKCNFPLFYV